MYDLDCLADLRVLKALASCTDHACVAFEMKMMHDLTRVEMTYGRLLTYQNSGDKSFQSFPLQKCSLEFSRKHAGLIALEAYSRAMQLAICGFCCLF